MPSCKYNAAPSPRGRLALRTPWKWARLIEWSQGLANILHFGSKLKMNATLGHFWQQIKRSVLSKNDLGVSKNRGETPKMDGENNGTPQKKNPWIWGKNHYPPLFLVQHPSLHFLLPKRPRWSAIFSSVFSWDSGGLLGSEPERSQQPTTCWNSNGNQPQLVGGWTTHLKNISQIGNLPQVGVKIKNVWNHHLDNLISLRFLWQLFSWFLYFFLYFCWCFYRKSSQWGTQSCEEECVVLSA